MKMSYWSNVHLVEHAYKIKDVFMIIMKRVLNYKFNCIV